MTRPRLLPLLLCAALVSCAIGARAQTVTVSLPPTGTQFTSLLIPFSDFNGTAVTGQHLLLDLAFANKANLRVYPAQILTNFSMWITFTVAPTAAFVSGMSIPGLSNFVGPGGNALPPSSSDYGNGIAVLAGKVTDLMVIASFRPNGSLIGQTFDVAGAHYDFTFPDLGGAQITSANLRIFNNNAGRVLVGPVPETGSTLAFLGLAALILVSAGKFARA